MGTALSTCLVLGGGDSLPYDLAAYSGPVDGAVACNDAGTHYAGDLDAWVSLHPRYFLQKKWLEKRKVKGYKPAKRLFGHMQATHLERIVSGVEFVDYEFSGQKKSGSSGLFAAKVALIDLGFDRVVLCGVPMTPTPHFFDRADWTRGPGFRKAWLELNPEHTVRMRSMSGWTRVLLGAPEKEHRNANPQEHW